MTTKIEIAQNTTQLVPSASAAGGKVTIIVKDGGGRGPAGDPGIYVGESPPDDPAENQLWLDISE